MKRTLSPHQKQMRLMTVLFMTLALAVFAALLYWFNQ